MVLNKSRWDHKAKIQYLKKHNLITPKTKEDKVTPKWSGKKSKENSGNSWLDDSENSDWDSEDEAVLNHFYPQISEDNLSVENKQKLKRQIMKVVKSREEAQLVQKAPEFDEENGIYLGEKPAKREENADLEYDDEYPYSDDGFELEIPDLEVKLSEFVVSDFGKSKNRKILKNKVSDNLLDEYGLDSYSSTVKDTDYNNTVKSRFKNIDKLDAADLHGLRIGEDSKREEKQPSVRTLNEAELEEHRVRAEILKHVKFHNQIKRKFGSDTTKDRKVLEINNFNANDKTQMESLNSKLTNNTDDSSGSGIMVEDLDELLGLKGEENNEANKGQFDVEPESADFLSQTLAKASLNSKAASEKKEPSAQKKVAADAFLDDLLGL